MLAAVPHNAREVWADGAYFSEKQEPHLKGNGYESHMINRTKKFPSHALIGRENSRRSKIRKRLNTGISRQRFKIVVECVSNFQQ